MNIFYLDENPIKCAEFHCDKHVVKMILEYAQLLSTTHRFLDGTAVVGLSKTGRKQTRYVLSDHRESILYSVTHINHPSAQWVRKSIHNYIWLADLLEECCKEYTYRYGKIHKVESMGLMQTLKDNVPNNIPNVAFTGPTPAMPEECKVPGDPLKSYHNYYYKEKKRMWSWQGKINSRVRPEWLNDMIMNELHKINEELGLTY
jgi:hypothetical protein